MTIEQLLKKLKKEGYHAKLEYDNNFNGYALVVNQILCCETRVWGRAAYRHHCTSKELIKNSVKQYEFWSKNYEAINKKDEYFLDGVSKNVYGIKRHAKNISACSKDIFENETWHTEFIIKKFGGKV